MIAMMERMDEVIVPVAAALPRTFAAGKVRALAVLSESRVTLPKCRPARKRHRPVSWFRSGTGIYRARPDTARYRRA